MESITPGEHRNSLFEGRRDSFERILKQWQETPPGNDMYIGAFAEAVLLSLGADTKLRDFFTELLSSRDIGSSHLATKTLRATQRQLYQQFPAEEGEYPRAFYTAEQWLKGFEWIFASEEPARAAGFAADILTRPLQSNVSERYKGLKGFAVLARKLGRLSTFSVLDIGCSQNAGLSHIASGSGFTPPNFVLPHSKTGAPNLPRTAAFHEALATPLPLDYGLGIDMYSPHDAREWKWLSHYPSELTDPVRVEQLKSLIDAEYGNIGFFQANFANLEPRREDFEREHGGHRFSIAHFSTTLYQANEDDRQTMLAEAERYADEFVVVQDFLEINPTDPTKLQFRDNWQDVPYPYRTVIRDLQDDGKRWHEIFLWQNGRARQLTMGTGRIAIMGAQGIKGRASLWSPLNEMARKYRYRTK